MFIDGVGAFDLISRNAMLQALLEIDGGEIAQSEEQGDPLMPLLFNLGQHVALVAANARLEDGERLFAYQDMRRASRRLRRS